MSLNITVVSEDAFIRVLCLLRDECVYVCVCVCACMCVHLTACFMNIEYFYYYSSISDAMNRAKANGDRATEKFAQVLWLNAQNFQQHLRWPQDIRTGSPSTDYYVPWFKRWLNNLGQY